MERHGNQCHGAGEIQQEAAAGKEHPVQIQLTNNVFELDYAIINMSSNSEIKQFNI